MTAVTVTNTSVLIDGKWVPLASCPPDRPLGASEVHFQLTAEPDTEANDACRQIMRKIIEQHRAQQYEHFLAWVEEMQLGHA